MNARTFMNRVARGEEDVLQTFLDLLTKHKAGYCVVGGLAVNAYCEPVVSLDLDLVIVSEKIEKILGALPRAWKVQEFPHSINISSRKSDLRIQLQVNYRYQDFIPRTRSKMVLGYRLQVAAIEDVLQGKIWAYQDTTRRASKRQKDLADIFRLVEAKPTLKKLLPNELKKLILLA